MHYIISQVAEDYKQNTRYKIKLQYFVKFSITELASLFSRYSYCRMEQPRSLHWPGHPITWSWRCRRPSASSCCSTRAERGGTSSRPSQPMPRCAHWVSLSLFTNFFFWNQVGLVSFWPFLYYRNHSLPHTVKFIVGMRYCIVLYCWFCYAIGLIFMLCISSMARRVTWWKQLPSPPTAPRLLSARRIISFTCTRLGKIGKVPESHTTSDNVIIYVWVDLVLYRTVHRYDIQYSVCKW